MPAESTFDIVSEFDQQELVNAVDQTQREVRTRYDLKDSNTELALGEKELTITSDAELHLAAVRDIFETKALRRNLSLKIFKWGTVEEIGGMRVRQVATLQQGIPDDVAKKLQKLIRDQFPKIQPRIQGDALRIWRGVLGDYFPIIWIKRVSAVAFIVIGVLILAGKF